MVDCERLSCWDVIWLEVWPVVEDEVAWEGIAGALYGEINLRKLNMF